MTKISRDELTRLASMSSIKLNESEVVDLQDTIGRVLGYVKQLEELDTDGVDPVYQVTSLQNVWRDDQPIADGQSRDRLLGLAPDQAKHQIKVPKVL